jgi:hypothetical protein
MVGLSIRRLTKPGDEGWRQSPEDALDGNVTEMGDPMAGM